MNIHQFGKHREIIGDQGVCHETNLKQNKKSRSYSGTLIYSFFVLSDYFAAFLGAAFFAAFLGAAFFAAAFLGAAFFTAAFLGAAFFAAFFGAAFFAVAMLFKFNG
jgi:hypothetical protein